MNDFLPLAEAPKRPKDALRVLLDGKDKVYDYGLLRWRYRDGKLLRVLEYQSRGGGYPPLRTWMAG